MRHEAVQAAMNARLHRLIDGVAERAARVFLPYFARHGVAEPLHRVAA